MIKKFKWVVFFIGFAFMARPAFSVQSGDEAPACSKPIHGSKQLFNIDAYRGKVVLIDFWATWCPPCKRSMPFFNDLRNELADSEFEIIAVNVDEDAEDATSFLKKYPVDYVVALDSGGDCAKAYEVPGMPSTYFVDKSGKVRSVHIGFRDSDKSEIRGLVEKLIAEK